ncbi:MAG: FHA domain-containing protein [Candidatus Promineifilaceae bacterium]
MVHVHVSWVNMRDQQDRGSVLTELPLNIGRMPDNEICLSDRMAGISRHHARVSAETGSIMLSDCDSLNGVYVGEQPIYQQTITNGTQFSVGQYLLTLREAIRCQNNDCNRPINPDSTMCQWCGQFSADAYTTFL